MYYLLLFLLYPLSLLPLPLLYLLSDLGYLIVFRMLGYRKRIVLGNLQFAFPEKSEDELQRIMRKFYRSFCDQWIETIKLMSISRRELDKRFGGNWEVFRRFNEAQKNVHVLLGHHFNWEWGNVASRWNSPQLFAGIYLPVSNKAVERLMLFIRKRSGAMMISAQELRPALKSLQQRTHILAFMADQTPASRFVKWYRFMHRPAPFFLGPEKSARSAQAAMVFAALRKIKRGYYYTELQVMCEDASVLPFGSITHDYVKRLEAELQLQPANWMWTHRRWKIPPPEDLRLDS